MYFLEQIKTQFLSSIVNYKGGPDDGLRGREDASDLSSMSSEDIDAYKAELEKLESTKESVNPYFEDLENQEWFKILSDPEKLQIKKIETQIETILQPYIDWKEKSNNAILRGLDNVEATEGVDKGTESNEELDDMSIGLMHKSLAVSRTRMKVEELMTKVRNMESGEVKTQRYNLVKEEYQALLDSPNLEQSQKHIVGKKSFNELTAGDFYALKKEKPELLATLLLSTASGDKVTPDMLNIVGTQLRVNFGTNQGLDQIVGAGDILPMRSVARVEINGTVGERRGEPRPGFYTSEGEYLAIHDGYKIKVLAVNELDDDAWTEFMTHVDKRYEDIRGAEIMRGIVDQINSDGENSLEFPQFMSDSDTDLLENYLSGKIPEYMKNKVVIGKTEEDIPNITIADPYTKEEFSSVLSQYKNVKSGMSEYFSENEELLDQRNVSISLTDFTKKTGITVLNTGFIRAAFQSMLRDESNNVDITISGTSISITSTSTIREVFAFGGGSYDLREYAHLHPREASLKNNNPSGLTYNNTFMRTLQRHGIVAERGTARPSREGGHYFGFPNIGEGIKAHNLLWDIKINKQANNTLGALLATWAVDTSSYRSLLGEHWNKRVGDIVANQPEVFHEIQMKQLRIESPGMYSILKQKDMLSTYHTIRAS